MPTQMRLALLALASASAATWWSGSGGALNPSPGCESTVAKPKPLGEEAQARLVSAGPQGSSFCSHDSSTNTNLLLQAGQTAACAYTFRGSKTGQTFCLLTTSLPAATAMDPGPDQREGSPGEPPGDGLGTAREEGVPSPDRGSEPPSGRASAAAPSDTTPATCAIPGSVLFSRRRGL